MFPDKREILKILKHILEHFFCWVYCTSIKEIYLVFLLRPEGVPLVPLQSLFLQEILKSGKVLGKVFPPFTAGRYPGF